MVEAHANTFDEALEFIITGPTLQQIIAFRPSEGIQRRINALLEANRNGVLTSKEQAELDEFEQVEHFMRQLKIHAHTKA